MGRPKKAKIVLASLDECNAAMGEYRAALVEIKAIEAERDRARALADTAFESRLNAEKSKAKLNEAALKAYYFSHLTEVEASGKKSYRLANGVMGRRDNPPSLERKDPSNWTWDVVKEAVKGLWGWKYFHKAPERELDRDALKKLKAEDLDRVGLEVSSTEKFYLEPDMAKAADPEPAAETTTV